jgi:hypothetical protein
VSFAAITLCVASQRVFIVVYFVFGSVRKLVGTSTYEERFLKTAVVKSANGGGTLNTDFDCL